MPFACFLGERRFKIKKIKANGGRGDAHKKVLFQVYHAYSSCEGHG